MATCEGHSPSFFNYHHIITARSLFILQLYSLLSCIISIKYLVYLFGDMFRYITHLDLYFSRHFVARWCFKCMLYSIKNWLCSVLSIRFVNCILWSRIRLGFLLMFTESIFLKIFFYIQIANYLIYLAFILFPS